MNKDFTIGKYQYSKLSGQLAGGMFLAGFAYAIATRKSPLGILAFSLVGSLAGFSVGALINKPKRVKE